MAAEKKRAEPFTEEERKVLLECMEGHKNIIENKRTDGTTVAKKNKAWESIAFSFNSYVNVNKRSAVQVRKAYNNMKARYKKEVAEQRRERLASGVGPSFNISEPLVEIMYPGVVHSRRGFDSEGAPTPVNKTEVGWSEDPLGPDPQSSTSQDYAVDSGLLSDTVSEGEDNVTAAEQSAPASGPTASVKRARLRGLSSDREHLRQSRQLHALFVREAVANMEAAEARQEVALEQLAAAREDHKAAQLQAQNEEEELAFQRERRKRLLSNLSFEQNGLTPEWAS